jgi:hypothetical protein
MHGHQQYGETYEAIGYLYLYLYLSICIAGLHDASAHKILTLQFIFLFLRFFR